MRGEVSITAPGFTKDLLASCRPTGKAITPATDFLFDARPSDTTVKASLEDVEYFHSYVAKLLYLGKRVRPEILTAVSFLTTRINPCDNDDMNKLARVLSYLATCPERGITLCIGDSIPSVSAQIDAAYGVHMDGKSHTGCTITIGDRGPCYFRSAKQRIVTKSSTEAELVALSDSANVPIHINRFLRAQGYDSPPAILYQDNKSAMALIANGRSTSDLTRHILLRHFWVTERAKINEVKIVHLPSPKMSANLLSKAVQGKQFLSERDGVTGWM